MKRQLRQSLIKIGLLAAMAMVIGVGSAQGQSLANTIKANIPFDFIVGNKKLPAGEYWIGRAQVSPGDMVLAISNSNHYASAMTIPAESLTPKHETILVFHRYGDQYFLSQVWPAGSNTGRGLPKSRQEREIGRKARDLETTPLGTAKGAETVCIVVGLQ